MSRSQRSSASKDGEAIPTGPNFCVPCESCRHKANGGAGWCYMFRNQPEAAKINQCGQHTGFTFGLSLLSSILKDAMKVTPNA